MSRVKPQCKTDEIREYVKEIAGIDADVEKIQSRNTTYSSFVIHVDKTVEDRVLDPDEWQEGLIIRPFRGALRRWKEDSSQPISEPITENPETTSSSEGIVANTDDGIEEY